MLLTHSRLNKIIVTGGAGFIGSHIVDRLLEMGAEVLIIDNYSTGNRENNQDHPNLTIVEGSISDSKLVNSVFYEFMPNTVIHAAASYKDPDHWGEDILTNVFGTSNIINAGKDLKIKRLIYLQTSLCYGLKPLESPVSLNHPFFSGSYSGGSSYAISKTAGEMYIELSGLDFVSFRLANTYGPRNLTGPLPAFYSRIEAGKEVTITDTRRDFIYVDDVVDCIIQAALGEGEHGYYHLSTGKDCAIKDLFDSMLQVMGISYDNVRIKPKGEDDVSTILIDPSKTFKVFGWKSKVDLREGIQKSIAYYRRFGLPNTYTHLKNIN